MSDIKETIKDFTTSTNVNRKLLMEKLSEFLAVEKGGIKLYRAAIQQAPAFVRFSTVAGNKGSADLEWVKRVPLEGRRARASLATGPTCRS